MGYLFLLLTIAFESTAVIFMKLSDGFHNRWQGAVAVTAYIISFIFLTLALKTLPVGMANAIWAGTSTVVVAVLGIYIFKEQLSLIQYIFMAFIIIGLVGLNLTNR